MTYNTTGMTVVCINDHLQQEKVNYLGRYVVLDEKIEEHVQKIKIVGRDHKEHWLRANRFKSAEEYDAPVEVAKDEPNLIEPGGKPFRALPIPRQYPNAAELGVRLAEAVERVPLYEAPLGGKVPAPNPKAAFGDKKPRLTLAPLSASLAQVEAQLDGMLKYGEVNWRENSVECLTYVDAALRHLRLYENGEDIARDTKVKNLGAVMACCAILIDAELHGTMIDNRKKSPKSCDELHERGEQMVALLRHVEEVRKRGK